MRRTFVFAVVLMGCAESIEPVEGYDEPPVTKKDTGVPDTAHVDTGSAPAPPPPVVEDSGAPAPDTAMEEDTGTPEFPDFDSGGDPGPPPPPDGGPPDPGADPCGCYDFCSFDCAYEFDPDKCEAECMAWCTSKCM